jgi:hypothetical protein
MIHSISIGPILLLATCLALSSCKESSKIKYRYYEVFAHTDITLTTEQGEILFIPSGALLKEDGSAYRGKAIIKLADYQNLLDSLSKFTKKEGTLMHLLQLSSPVIDCMDEHRKSLQLNAAQGYELLVFMPLIPATASEYESRPVRKPGEIFVANAFDSFDLRTNFTNLPSVLDMDKLLALSKRVPLTDSTDRRQDAALAYSKIKSITTLKNYLALNWDNAAGRFLNTTNASELRQLKNDRSDKPDSIPYMGFSILELYNKTGKTSLVKIFEKYARQWQQSLLIVDWTGSMRIHEAEIDSLIESMELKKIIRHIILYNDKPDPQFASLTSNEGIFWIDSVTSFNEVKNLMNECAGDYGGGEHLEESDYSALIRATSAKSPPWKSSYKQVIMLVDNNAPPRDSFLFNSIELPTKIFVIAFGTSKACEVRAPYHELVRRFGGLLFAEGSQSNYNSRDSVSYHNCQNPEREKCLLKK